MSAIAFTTIAKRELKRKKYSDSDIVFSFEKNMMFYKILLLSLIKTGNHDIFSSVAVYNFAEMQFMYFEIIEIFAIKYLCNM